MKNYRIFTQNYVLQDFNAKEPKTSKKNSKNGLGRKCRLSGHFQIMSRQKFKTSRRSLSQQKNLCHDKDKEDCLKE